MVKVARVEVRAHVHATELEERVLQAIKNVLGSNELPDVKILKARGHHGNPINTIYLELKGKEAEQAVKNIFKKLSDTEFNLLMIDLEDRSEKSKLYLRFDKQDAYKGELHISEGSDVVRILIVFKGMSPSEELLKEIRKG